MEVGALVGARHSGRPSWGRATVKGAALRRALVRPTGAALRSALVGANGRGAWACTRGELRAGGRGAEAYARRGA